MTFLTIFAALLTLAIGVTVLWANPRRHVNQTFACMSLASALWLCFILIALLTGSHYPADLSANPVPWLRLTSAVGAFFPLIIWMLKESILRPDETIGHVMRRSWPWLTLVALLAALCFTNYFIPSSSTPDNPSRGVGYLIYSATCFVLYLVLVIVGHRQMRRELGVLRIEMQFLIVNCGLACLAAIALTAIGSYSDLRFLSRLSPLAILTAYALTAWAVTFHKIFDARQVFLALGQRLVLLLTLCLGALGLWRLSQPHMPTSIGFLLSVALCGSITYWLDRHSREWLRLSPEQNIATTRRAVIDLARSEPSPDKLVVELENLLRTRCQTTYARLLFDSGELYASNDLEFAKDRPAHAALCKAGWSTPESLQRQRAEPGLVDLRQFLTEFALGLVVTAPRGSAAPSLLLTLGIKTNPAKP